MILMLMIVVGREEDGGGILGNGGKIRNKFWNNKLGNKGDGGEKNDKLTRTLAYKYEWLVYIKFSVEKQRDNLSKNQSQY